MMTTGLQARLASGRTLLLMTGVTIAFYLAIVLGTAPILAEHAGGLAIFDLMPMGYDPAYARLLLDRLGDDGRQYYLTRQIPLDVVFPGLLALWLIGVWGYMVRQSGLTAAWLRRVWVAAVLIAAFDYAENAAVAGLLVTYPDLDTNLIRLASGFTITKSGLSTLCFSGLLVLAAWLAVRRLWRPAASGKPDAPA